MESLDSIPGESSEPELGLEPKVHLEASSFHEISQ